MRNKLICAILACVMLSYLAVAVSATKPVDQEGTDAEAVQIAAKFTVSDGSGTGNVSDSKEATYITVPAGGSITVESEDIGALYIKFHLKAKEWTASVNGEETKFGKDGFLHEFAALNQETDTVTMTFPEETQIAEIMAFTSGTPSSDVQVWQKPHEKTDVLLLSSHSDDEQLFFAGLIPHCVANDIDIQVVYFCYHDNEPGRLHEQLNGLWTAGMRNYPVIGRFPDLYSESMDWALNSFAGYGYGREDFVAYQCEMIRRFKPEIVVAHDVDGEYGHGTHRLNTDTLREALELTADSTKFAESAEKYGTWNVPKTYIHLWKENGIVMNYDIPLDHFGGRTAYEMSVAGYRCHNSQQWTWFTDWLVGPDGDNYTKASQIDTYSPCEYGLYRTIVGDDTNGDMFENVPLRKDIPPETTAPPVTEPEDTSAKTSAADVTKPVPDPSVQDGGGAEKILLIAVAAVLFAGGICAVVMMKKD